MILYDDKTKNIIKTGNQLLIPTIDASEDVTFKASYVVSSDLKCKGKIVALFDLIVFGDVCAQEINVKGRFVCMGCCSVSNAIVVHDDIWCEEINAESITCHDKIVAQSINAEIVIAEGNIIIGKTLEIEEKAQTNQYVICGETAYGAGRIIASSILTVEPLDLDDGEEALESPFQYIPNVASGEAIGFISSSIEHVTCNDYEGFLLELMGDSNGHTQELLDRYLSVLKTVEKALPHSVRKLRDVSTLIWLLDLSHSEYFKGWNKIAEWTDLISSHFKNMAVGKVSGEHEPRPATKLLKGYTVSHHKYGKGIVRAVLQTAMKGKTSCVAVVDFENYGEKKFPLPDSLKFFDVLSENEIPSTSTVGESMQCNVDSYSEWLHSMNVINQYKDYLGECLYNKIYSLLLEKLGLKPKYVEDRFKEKGWN